MSYHRGGLSPHRRFWTALAGILAIAAALRVAHLARSTYWIDEVFESSLAHAPSGAFWTSLAFDAAHPPLDYLAARAAVRLGVADPWPRGASVLWGVATVAALAALLRRRAGARAALLTAALLAVAPFHVRYSQELRPYALGTFLAVLSLLLLDRTLERPSLARGAALLLCLLGAGYTLYFAAAAAALGAAAMLSADATSPDAARRAVARRFAALGVPAAALLAVLYAPWWAVVRSAAGRFAMREAPAIDPRRLRLALAFFTVSPKQEGWSFGPRPVYAAAFAAALLLLAAGTAAAAARPALRWLPIWGLGGILAAEVLRAVSPRFGPFRYALPFGVALPAIAAVGADALLARPRLRVAAAAAVAFLLLFEGAALAFYYRAGRYDWSRELALLRSRPASEPIFTGGHNPQYCIAYYLCGPAWLTGERRCARPIVDLEGSTAPLDRARRDGQAFALVLDGMPESAAPRAWAEGCPEIEFPEAEGTVVALVPAGRCR